MKFQFVILLFITLLAAVFRLYKLGQVPAGLYQDETAIAYNAYSIRATGNDEYGRKFPIYFESFGDWKLPVYIYTTAIAQDVFGMNAFSTRLPSALFGILTVFMFYFFVKELTDHTNLALLSTLFLAVTPWHIHYSRATFEVSMVLFFFVSGSFCLLRSLKQKKRGMFVVGTLLFIIALYTYNLTRLLSPLLFAGIVLLNWKKRKNVSVLEYGITAVLSLIALIPFILTFFSGGGAQSAAGTLIVSSAAVQAPLLEFRSYFVNYPIINKLVFNYFTLTGFQYLQHIAGYASVPFFFITGSNHGNHGIATNGQFYLFELPLMILAVYVLFKEQKRLFTNIMLPAILTVLVAALTREAPHATRAYTLLMTAPILSAYGAEILLKRLERLQKLKKYILFVVSVLIISFSFIQYGYSYMIRFPIAYAPKWRTADSELGLYLKKNESNYEKILIDKDAGFIYSSLVYYTEFSPSLFQNTVVRTPPDNEGFRTVERFGKYEYKQINWDTDYYQPKTLIITTPNNKPATIVALREFLYPLRPIVMALKQEIIYFPTQDKAYVVVESNP